MKIFFNIVFGVAITVLVCLLIVKKHFTNNRINENTIDDDELIQIEEADDDE